MLSNMYVGGGGFVTTAASLMRSSRKLLEQEGSANGNTVVPSQPSRVTDTQRHIIAPVLGFVSARPGG